MSLVECLNCGQTRRREPNRLRRIQLGDSCLRCGYVGWAPSADLTEPQRRALRERPVERRRLVTV